MIFLSIMKKIIVKIEYMYRNTCQDIKINESISKFIGVKMQDKNAIIILRLSFCLYFKILNLNYLWTLNTLNYGVTVFNILI